MPLEFDCCEAQGKNFSLNNKLLVLPLNNVIHHLDDLKVANYKVEEVEYMIAEQNWKLKTFKYGLSSLLFVLCQNGFYDLNLFFLFYYFCKHCLKLCPKFSRGWKENIPCTTIVFKPKIVNLIHSSKESLKYPNARASMKG